MSPSPCSWLWLVLGGTLAALSAAIADDALKPLPPVEARKKVGEEDEKNFAAVINKAGAAGLREKGVTDFEEHFRNKKIRFKGRVTVVDDVPRIEVSDPAQIELVKAN